MRIRELYSKGMGVIFRLFLISKSPKNENKKDYKTYKYLEKKYSNFIKELPKYKEEKDKDNVIWWCWLQGEENTPKLNKSCLSSIKKYVKDKKVIIISEKNIQEYVTFPDFIIKKYKNGIISKAHFTDLLRLELLIKYGGTWIDSSVFLTGYNKELFDSDFLVFKNNSKSIIASSWFITSNKNNPILKITRDILYDYWEHRNFQLHYYLFHLCFTLASKNYNNIINNMPSYSNIETHLMQKELLNKYDKNRFEELKKLSTVHKLSNHIKDADNDSLFRYIENWSDKNER